MKRVTFIFPGIAILLSIGCIMASTKKNDASENGFVLMELFTSQGCSSCPPADDILANYANQNDDRIIPLSFHVDYWNRLGWVDPFSNSTYSQRQTNYAQKFNLESVYTPQMIINGQTQLTGSEEDNIAGLVKKYIKENTTTTISISSINVVVSNSSINAVLVLKKVTTKIKAGENRGVELTNYNVVRDINSAPLSNAKGNCVLQIPEGADVKDYKVVLFIQQNESGKITGAIQSKLP
jgi:hypothetical protein